MRLWLRRRAVRAFLISFAVYLIPVIGLHNFWLWGEALASEMLRLPGGREPAWAALDLALALGVQAAAFALLLWVLSGASWRWLAMVLAFPGFTYVINAAYLETIPVLFLIEADVAPQRTDWEVACRIEDAWVAPLKPGPNLSLTLSREAWLVRGADQRFLVLSMPGCRVRELPLGNAANVAMIDAAPGGTTLFSRIAKETQRRSFRLLAGGEERRLSEPDAGLGYWAPKLAPDGHRLAWISRVRDTAKPGFVYTLHVGDVENGDELSFRLRPPVASHPELLGFDRTGRELIVVSGFDEAYAVDLEGRLTWGPVGDPAIARLGEQLVRFADGWLIWDGYREDGRYQVAWSLSAGRGRHGVLKGRAITHIALDGWGRHIALSVTRSLAIGDVPDAVYVIRTADGAEVYRRYLPSYARSQIAFLGAHFLALSRYDGNRAWVEVLRLPGPGDAPEVRAWIEAYRNSFAAIVPLFAKFDQAGLGEEDCGPFEAAKAGLPAEPPPDPVTAHHFAAITRELETARFQCARWDPGPFAEAVAALEFLMAGLSEELVSRYGIASFPELGPKQGRGSFTIVPVTTGDGRVRAKREGGAQQPRE